MDLIKEVFGILLLIADTIINGIIYEIDGLRLKLMVSEQHREEAVIALDKNSDDIRNFNLDVQALLLKRDFPSLMRTIEEAQQQYESGKNLNNIHIIIKNLTSNKPGYLELVNEWIKEHPESWIPYAVRGNIYASIGSQARGNRYASETSSLQFKNMRDAYQKSEKDIRKVMKMKPSFMHAYRTHLGFASNGIGTMSDEEILQKALAQDRGSYYIRYTYLVRQGPKWGGSLADLRRTAITFQSGRKYDPRIYGLLGHEFKIRASIAAQEKNHEACITLLNNAFEYGDLYEWRTLRAYCYGQLGRTNKQLADLMVISDKATYADTETAIAEVYRRKGNMIKAIEHINKAVSVYKEGPYYKNYKGWYHILAGEDDVAYAVFQNILKDHKHNSYAAKNIAKLLFKKGRREEALPYLEISARYGNKDARAWLAYADVLKDLDQEKHKDALATYLQIVDRNNEGEFEEITKVESYLKGVGYWD